MKKLIAICMVLALLMASASAAEWPEGYGPDQPNENVPKIDLTTKLGYMMFYPNAQVSMLGGKTLFIFLPREDVKAGTGSLHIKTSDGGEEYVIAMNDSKHVRQRALSELELAWQMWGGGTCFEITLPVSLRLGTTYNVDMDAMCIIDTAETLGSPEIKGDDPQLGWHFTLEDTYGVSEVQYRRLKGDGSYETVTQPTAGDEICFDLKLGGEAVMAVVYMEGNAVFLEENLTEGGEVIGTVTGDDPDWGVMFLNSDFEELGFVEF
ncbi:MAG: hypothetical protein J1E43_06940 [Christensenellaceae bacterium]|nr:hypothetical protein [Christensenellaceae bacterium]